MTANHRHATDRKDWTIIAECPYNGRPGPIMVERDLDESPDDCEHLTVQAQATNAEVSAREAIPIEECPVCGAELDIIAQSTPTEALE